MKKKTLCLVLALVCAMTVLSTAFAADYSARYGDNTLKRSSTVKTVVKNVQADLTKNTSYTLTHDGIFGSMTENAAEEFQKLNDLDQDGQVGKYKIGRAHV